MASVSSNTTSGWSFASPFAISNMSANVFVVNSSNVVATLGGNTLDDGNGNMQYSNLTCSGSAGMYWDGNGNLLFKSAATNSTYWCVATTGGSTGNPAFKVYNNTSSSSGTALVATNGVQLDDGGGNMSMPYPTVNAQPCRFQIGNNSDFQSGVGGDHFAVGIAAPSAGTSIWPFGIAAGGQRRLTVNTAGAVATYKNVLDDGNGNMSYYNTLSNNNSNIGIIWKQFFNGQFQSGATSSNYWVIYDNNGNALFELYNQSGNLTVKGSFSFTSSDRSRKKNIKAYSFSALEKIDQLRPVQYQTKVEFQNDPSCPFRYGFIAQDVQGVFPELVNEAKGLDKVDELCLTLQYLQLVPILTKAVQELDLRQDDQNTTLDKLEAKLSNIELELLDMESLLNSSD